jgi:TonB family protein
MKKVFFLVIISMFIILGCAAGVKKAPGDASKVPYETPPEKIYSPRIQYPEKAYKAGYKADVWVRHAVDSTGAVGEIEVVKVNGQTGVGFEEEAIRVASETKWKPATTNSVPKTTIITYKIVFYRK